MKILGHGPFILCSYSEEEKDGNKRIYKYENCKTKIEKECNNTIIISLFLLCTYHFIMAVRVLFRQFSKRTAELWCCLCSTGELCTD